MIVLTGLIVLLAGCSSSGAGAERVVRVTPAPIATTSVAALTDKDVQRITLANAKELLDNGTAVLYDARSAKAYNSKHAAGAISLPENEVAARFNELPADKVLIFYCT
jgi:hypothetical protein